MKITQTDKNIKICERLGWATVNRVGCTSGWDNYQWQFKDDAATFGNKLPNHFACLNACQKLWDQFGWEEKNEYIEVLKEVVKEADCESYFATAEQRAEAFGRYIGLWEDGE